jgi:hypothetical protein
VRLCAFQFQLLAAFGNRYAARPAVSMERLSELPDGRVLQRLKRPKQNPRGEWADRANFENVVFFFMLGNC